MFSQLCIYAFCKVLSKVFKAKMYLCNDSNNAWNYEVKRILSKIET